MTGKLLNTLDRYLLKRGTVVLLATATLMIVVAFAFDLLINIGTYAAAMNKGNATLGTILSLYAQRLPQLANIALPVGMIVSALVLCAPMLTRNEFIALSASGVSLRRATRVLLVLALIVGAVDALIADRLSPHAIARSTAIEDQLQRQHRQGRVWSVPATGTSWFAGAVHLLPGQDPHLEGVVIANADQLITAERVVWRGELWHVDGALLRFGPDARGSMALTRPTVLGLSGSLDLPYSPTELYRQLLPRFTLASDELLTRGEKADFSVILGRLLRTVLPALAIMAALPVFVRFAHRTTLVTGAIKALAAAAVPTVLLIGTAAVADSTALPVTAMALIGTVLAVIPALRWWLRWQL